MTPRATTAPPHFHGLFGHLAHLGRHRPFEGGFFHLRGLVHPVHGHFGPFGYFHHYGHCPLALRLPLPRSLHTRSCLFGCPVRGCHFDSTTACPCFTVLGQSPRYPASGSPHLARFAARPASASFSVFLHLLGLPGHPSSVRLLSSLSAIAVGVCRPPPSVLGIRRLLSAILHAY